MRLQFDLKASTGIHPSSETGHVGMDSVQGAILIPTYCHIEVILGSGFGSTNSITFAVR
jgi:hypothetical protein